MQYKVDKVTGTLCNIGYGNELADQKAKDKAKKIVAKQKLS